MDPIPVPPASLTSVHVRQAIAGSAESLGWLVARLTPLLMAAASYRLGPALRAHCDPEDLVADAWLVALPRLRAFTSDGGRHTPILLQFLSTTIVHRINNLVRKHLRGEPAEPLPSSSDLHVASASGADQTSVVGQVVRRETRSLVHACLDDLEPKDREILILRGIEQIPNQTVAMLLGLSPQAVAMRFRRALERLRAKLPGSVFEELLED